MKAAIGETDRRRAIQVAHNTEHNIQPATIIKQVRDLTDRMKQAAVEDKAKNSQPDAIDLADLSVSELAKMGRDLEKEMKNAARNLEFEKAAALRDQLVEVRKMSVLKSDPIKGGDGMFESIFEA